MTDLPGDPTDETETALRALLAGTKVGGTVQLDDDLPAAGLTSLATVDLMLAIEDRFEVEFPETLLNRRTFATLGNLAEAVRSLRSTA